MPPIPDEYVDTASSAAVEIRVNAKTKDESEVVNGDTFRLEAESVESPLSNPDITALLPAEIDESETKSEVRFVLGQLISQLLQAHGDEDEYIIENVWTSSNGHNSDQDADEEERPVNTVVLSEPPPPSASTSQSPPPIASADISTAPLTVDISSTSSAVVVGDKKVAGEEEEEEEQPITPPPLGASVPISPTSAKSATGGGKNSTTLFVPTEVCYNYHRY